MVLTSFIFSYMNLGEFAVYSFLNYDVGFMGGLYSLFILSIIIISESIPCDACTSPENQKV